MVRTPSWLFLLTALAGCGVGAAAQTPSAPPAAGQTAEAPAPPESDLATSPSIFSHAPAPLPQLPPQATIDDRGDQRRLTDQELSSAIAAGLPKYSPPKPEPKPSPQADLRDVDKPRNRIIRLPAYIVRPPPPPVFSESEILTQQGLADLAMKRYVGIDPSQMPSLVGAGLARLLFQGYAEQMYQDDLRLQNMAELGDSANALQRAGDTGESAFLKSQSDDIYMRSPGDTVPGLDPHAGWGAPVPSNSNSVGTPGLQQ